MFHGRWDMIKFLYLACHYLPFVFVTLGMLSASNVQRLCCLVGGTTCFMADHVCEFSILLAASEAEFREGSYVRHIIL
jgi:hypothetical protein